jgi:hypothetical protein
MSAAPYAASACKYCLEAANVDTSDAGSLCDQGFLCAESPVPLVCRRAIGHKDEHAACTFSRHPAVTWIAGATRGNLYPEPEFARAGALPMVIEGAQVSVVFGGPLVQGRVLH